MSSLVDPKAPLKGFCPSCIIETNLFSCCTCEGMAYCSVECQEADQPVHALLCAALMNFNESTRPSKLHRRAILFREDGELQFIWLVVTEDYHFELAPIFGDKLVEGHLCSEDTAQLGAHLSTQDITLFACSDSIDEVANESIKRLGDPSLAFDCRGPLLAIGDDGDLTMNDFRAVVDWLQCYPFNTALLDPARFGGKKYHGVISTTSATVDGFQVPSLVPVQFSQSMILSMSINCKTITLLKNLLPLCYVYRVQTGEGKNVFQQFRLHDLEHRLTRDGHIHRSWWSDCTVEATTPGSMIYFRKDWKALLPEHLEMLESFVLMKLAGAHLACDGEYVDKDRLASMLTTEAFDEYWTAKNPGEDDASKSPLKM